MDTQRHIKITIMGNAYSGKSNIALLIKDTLSAHGIEIEVNEQFPEESEDKLREIRPQAFKSLKDLYKGRTIQLDIVNPPAIPSADGKTWYESKFKATDIKDE